MRHRVCTALLLWLPILAAAVTMAHAEMHYAGSMVTLASTTDGKPQDIPATLLKPEGDGPFPAVVILHDCSGLGARSSGSPGRWSQLLAAEGYVVIVPDSFLPRSFAQGVCTTNATGPLLRTTFPLQRAVDAFAARDYLRGLPFVDSSHIGVMGGSHGGSSTLMAMVDAPNPLAGSLDSARGGFAAGIALYPGCGSRYGGWTVERQFGNHGAVTRYVGVYKPVAPLLILIGEKDDWTPADQCQALAQAAQNAGYPVTIKVYPGAYHSFDSSVAPRYADERRNVNKPEGHGATTGGDSEAWADAVIEVKKFFGRYLQPGGAAP